jgi:hypothetical protein
MRGPSAIVSKGKPRSGRLQRKIGPRTSCGIRYQRPASPGHPHDGRNARQATCLQLLSNLKSETMSESGGLVLDHLSSGRNLMFSGRLGSSRSQLKEVLALRSPTARLSIRLDSTPIARRNRDAARCGRRFDRPGRRSSAGRRRRDAEPRGTPARDRRAEHGHHRREHAKTTGQSLRARGPGAQRT